jgi:hypothetical protein
MFLVENLCRGANTSKTHYFGEAELGKKARLRRRVEEVEASISDLGLLAAKLKITDETKLSFLGSLQPRDLHEFMSLHEGLHRYFIRFGLRDEPRGRLRGT